ncbi:MAG: hypothetical protein H0T55_09030 [Rubrobacteraceae bacterium]|jgi:hypothetical protein|nr:hypothetical protein [Rubrobacteraceae bacterium]
MSKNGLHRHYDRLTPEERFRLDVLAMARGDAAESERLVGSCPKFSYTMNDRGFAGRWHGAIEMTLRIYIPLGEQLAKLQMVDAFRVFVPYSQALSSNTAFDAYFTGHESGSRHAWAHAGKTGGPPAWPDDGPDGELMEPDEGERDPAMERDTDGLEATVERYGEFLPEVLDELELRTVKQAFSVWTGYVAFCEESMGVAAEKIAAVVLEPVIGCIADMKLRAERLGVKAEAELVEEMREKLGEAWRAVGERGV